MYLRNATRPQGDRRISVKQDNFGGGLVTDIPASDIDNNAVAGLENYVAYERYLEGRSGSYEFDNLGGSGTVHSTLMTPSGKLIIHRGSQLFINFGPQEILNYADESFGIDTESTMRMIGDNVLVATASGLFLVLFSESLGNPGKFLHVNPENPINTITNVVTDLDYVYAYTATLSTIINTTDGSLALDGNRLSDNRSLIHETGPRAYGPGSGGSNYWGAVSNTADVGSGNQNTVPTGGSGISANAEVHHTHITIYRTVNIGASGLGYYGITQGTDPLIFSWIDDVPINDYEYYDGIGDDVVSARIKEGLVLKTIGFEPLPNGNSCDVDPSFLFVFNRGSNIVHYSQRTEDGLNYDSRMGLYHPAYQYKKLDDFCNEIRHIGSIVTYFCNRSTYYTITTAKDYVGNAGVLEFIANLTHLAAGDKNIGVTDYGSIADVENAGFMALCSDRSVRLWDGSQWSRDLAEMRVSNQLNAAVAGKSVGAYYRGAYLLWFCDDSSLDYPNRTLRYASRATAGKGWSEYTGDGWIYPPAHCGVISGKAYQGYSDDLFLFAIDPVNDKVYWIETFDGPTDATMPGGLTSIRKLYGDRVNETDNLDGTEIVCKIKTKENTGENERWNLIHSESHLLVRELEDQKTRPQILIDALGYVDGSLVRSETAGKIDTSGPIQFWYKVEGRRIAVEFQVNRSGHRIVGIEHLFRVQDILVVGTGPNRTVAATFQNQLGQNVQLHLTRPKVMADRISKKTLNSALITTQTAPDGRSQALQVGNVGGTPTAYTFGSTELAGEFTIRFWATTPTMQTNVITIPASGANSAMVVNISPTSITIDGVGTVTLSSVGNNTGSVNGYDLIMLVRQPSSSVISVFQNGILRGTMSSGSSFGGGAVVLGAT